jgi:hypothetical protein
MGYHMRKGDVSDESSKLEEGKTNLTLEVIGESYKTKFAIKNTSRIESRRQNIE